MMKIQIGQTTIKFSVSSESKTFSANIITPMAGTWVEITISKGEISKGNLHIEVNIDNEITGG